MKTWTASSVAAPGVALFLLMPACGSPGEGTGTQTEGGTGGASTGTASSTGDGGTGPTAPTTGDGGSVTDGMTSTPTTGGPTSTTVDPSATDATTDATTGPGATDGTTGSTGPVDQTTGTSSGGDSTTGEPCVPTPEVCNDLDDDCNDIVDDVDIAGDGICDCLEIALFGVKGSNPAAQFEMWLEAQGTKVDRIQLDNTPVTAEIVDSYDIIILDRLVRDYAPAEAAVMQDWVLAGGGLMAMTGYSGQPPDVTRPNSILAPMGLAYNNSKGIFSGPVTQWTPHPVSQDITSVTFLGGFYIDVTDDGVGMNTVVATLPQGNVAVAQVRADGKLFVWGDEWIEFDSEWQNMAQIKQLWANILGYLSPANFCTVPQ